MTNIREAFGEPIGNYAGQSNIGVRNEPETSALSVCKKCKLMPVGGACGCGTYIKDNSPVKEASCTATMELASESYSTKEADETCDQCGMMEVEIGQGCGCMKEAKKGPSKKTAKKILKGTKTFKDKMEKVSGWADDPAAAAAWMMHKATGKWPSEK
jgi:hypothetical protein